MAKPVLTPEAKAAFEKVADHLERGVSPNQEKGVGFNMAGFYDEVDYHTKDHTDACGTIACISGHVALLLGEDPEAVLHAFQVFPVPPEDQYDAAVGMRDLFYGSGGPRPPLSQIKPQDAAKALRNWLETGEPDWHGVYAKDEPAGVSNED